MRKQCILSMCACCSLVRTFDNATVPNGAKRIAALMKSFHFWFGHKIESIIVLCIEHNKHITLSSRIRHYWVLLCAMRVFVRRLRCPVPCAVQNSLVCLCPFYCPFSNATHKTLLHYRIAIRFVFRAFLFI